MSKNKKKKKNRHEALKKRPAILPQTRAPFSKADGEFKAYDYTEADLAEFIPPSAPRHAFKGKRQGQGKVSAAKCHKISMQEVIRLNGYCSPAADGFSAVCEISTFW